MHAYNSISLHFNCRTFHTMLAPWRQRLPTLTQLYCWSRHVASFLKVWKGSQSDPNYLDKQNNSLLISFLSLLFFLHASRKGGGASFLFAFLYVNSTKMFAPRNMGGGGGLALLDATCLLGSWKTFTYTLQFLVH